MDWDINIMPKLSYYASGSPMAKRMHWDLLI
jgi:hypothetical protein